MKLLKDKKLSRMYPRGRAGVLIGSVFLIASGWSGCQPRKQGELENNVPQKKGSYVPQAGPGTVPNNPQGSPQGAPYNPGAGTPSTPNAPGSLAATLSPTTEASILSNWTGTIDQPAPGWKLVDLQPAAAPTPALPQSTPPGTPSPISSTGSAVGTGSGRPPTSSATASVTYSNQIKPLLAKYCVSCHQAGGERSSSPLNVYPGPQLGKQSVARIKAGSMPKPGSSQLSPAEKEIFQQWETGNFAQ